MTLRDANTFQPTGKTFLSNRAVAGEHLVRFSADGRLMMTVGDGKAQLWDFASGERIGDVFPAADSWTGAPSGDLRWLVTAIDGRAIRWDLDVDAWPAVACRAAGRIRQEPDLPACALVGETRPCKGKDLRSLGSYWYEYHEIPQHRRRRTQLPFRLPPQGARLIVRVGGRDYPVVLPKLHARTPAHRGRGDDDSCVSGRSLSDSGVVAANCCLRS